MIVAAHKAENENEEAYNKLRAAMTTYPVEGTTELGHQINKLLGCPDHGKTGQQPSQCSKQLQTERP